MTSIGKQIGRYKLRSVIGSGGMGQVFLAEDEALNRLVAVKILPALNNDGQLLRRFEREARAASALNHPNILTVHEFGTEGGTSFLVTEYVEGETLRARINGGALELTEALDIAAQIASALQSAHSAGIIHRDIKPENVMIRKDGYVKVLDFGLAKLNEQTELDAEAKTKMQMQTQTGMIVGTVAYMSPEQARGKAVDARTDVFSLGVVLYETLTRKQPFTGETINHTIVSILEDDPPPPAQFFANFPAEVEKTVYKCLAKNPNDRYQTAQDLFDDLKALKEEMSFQEKSVRFQQYNVDAAGQTVESVAPPVSFYSNLDEQALQSVPPTEANSIAVLPFANLSAEPDNEYFCDGLAEELLNALAKIDDLRVAARTSAFSFKGTNTEVGRIAKTLKVKTILEGSVRKSGNRLRITVQLINAADGYHIWSERYDREMRDIFDVQDEITLAVVEALKLKLFGAKKADLLRRYTDNPLAYELYLKGRYFYNKYTPEDFRKGIEFFEKAIELDAQYAPAYAGIGFCYGAIFYFGIVAPLEIVPKWRAVINKALEIDDCLADAYLSRASIHFYYDWDFAQAEEGYRRALAINPNNPDAHWRYGHFLALVGRFDEAIAQCKKAVELDPLSIVVRFFMARIYGLAGRHDESFEQVRKMLEIEPSFGGAYMQLGGLYMMKGMYDKAAAEYQRSLELSGFSAAAISYLGACYGVLENTREAHEMLDWLLKINKTQYVTPFCFARVYSGLGELDKAFEWFEKSFDERNGEMVTLESETRAYLLGKSVTRDPRFTDLIRRVGLPTS